MSKWQTMETAPTEEDGGRVLLYRAYDKAIVCAEPYNDGWLLHDGGYWKLTLPTHWMPVPELPKEI